VTAAVDAYLKPLSFWSKSRSTNLRSILQRIFVAVREAANGINQVWGPDAPTMPGYREALIETAVCVNSAQAAYDLHVEVEKAGKWEIEVLYGVYNLFTHQVSMPPCPGAKVGGEETNLAHAPTNPREFNALAVLMAERLRPASLKPPKSEENGKTDLTPSTATA